MTPQKEETILFTMANAILSLMAFVRNRHEVKKDELDDDIYLSYMALKKAIEKEE